MKAGSMQRKQIWEDIELSVCPYQIYYEEISVPYIVIIVKLQYSQLSGEERLNIILNVPAKLIHYSA